MSDTYHSPPPPTPPPVQATTSLPLSPPSTASVRRVHTISSSSSRSRSRIVEESPGWEDGVGLEEDYMAYEGLAPEAEWDDGVGAWAGESGLQRHNSMPSRYSRAFSSRHSQHGPPLPAGSQLKMRNSLSEIQAEAEGEGEEEEWERDMRGLRTHDEDPSTAPALSPTDPLTTPTSHTPHTHSRSQSQSSTSSPLSPFLPSLYPNPSQPYPLAGEELNSDMRRHQSLTYGQRRISDRLARSPALRHPPSRSRHAQTSSLGSVGSVGSGGTGSGGSPPPAETATPPPKSPIRASPWGTPPVPSSPSPNGGQQVRGGDSSTWEARLEQVQRTIAQFALDGAAHMTPAKGQAAQGTPAFSAPRFMQQGQAQEPPQQQPQPAPQQSQQQQQQQQQQPTQQQPTLNQPWGPAPRSPPHQQQAPRPPLNLVTALPGPPKGPTSAAPAFPALGHGAHTNPYIPSQYTHTPLPIGDGRLMPMNMMNVGMMGMNMPLNMNMNMNMNMMGLGVGVGGGGGGLQLPAPPPLPAGYSGKHLVPRSPQPGASAEPTPTQGSFDRIAQAQPPQVQVQGPGQGQGQPQAPAGQGVTSPVDVPALVAAKGYNPAQFDIAPGFARYFVIKSYTEDDVHKSLKYEIWSSTEPGNKRLDRAFKENGGRGPIYLFFSVNASGHFCGMAEMLTPVDYTRSSTVWAQDKWKGVFKVRWIFVRDVPNSALRHIKLSNTQEKKPVTNSRDTQELLPDAGHEMLRIFLSHPARTSLLQDFGFYESMQKPVQSPSPPAAGQLAPFPMQGAPHPQPQQQQQPQQPQQHQQPPHFAHAYNQQQPPPPPEQYEQTLQGILRRHAATSPAPPPPPHQVQAQGVGAVQLPPGATGTQFVPGVGMGQRF